MTADVVLEIELNELIALHFLKKEMVSNSKTA